MPLSRWWLVAALAPFALVEASRWGDLPAAQEGDYAQYLLHAKAIVEGRPYADIGYIYTPLNFVGPRVQPPGWPVVLAPFVWVFGTDLVALRAVLAVIVALAALAGGLIAWRRGPVHVATVSGFVALSLESQRATGSLLSDPLFCLVSWTALWVADRDGPWSRRRLLGVLLLCAAAISVRIAGIALVPAMVAWLVWRTRAPWRRAALSGLASLGVIAAILMIAVNDVPFVGQVDLLEKLSRDSLVSFLWAYKQAFLSSTLYPFPWDIANDAYHLALVPVLITGAVRLLREGPSVHWVFLVTYSAMLYFAPVADPRYAWPLLPVIVWCLVDGLTAAFEWIRARLALVPRAAPAIVTGVIMMAATARLLAAPSLPTLQGDPDTREVFDVIERANAISPARIVFQNPRVLTLETGVPAMGYPHGTPDLVLQELRDREVTHVVVPLTGPVSEIEAPLIRLAGEHPDLLPEIFVNASYSVRRVSWPDRPPTAR